MERAKVYFTPEISPDALQRMYHALERSLTGRVAVKISTGEPGGRTFLQPSLIRGILLHGKIRMIFHKQRLLFVSQYTLTLCQYMPKIKKCHIFYYASSQKSSSS